MDHDNGKFIIVVVSPIIVYALLDNLLNEVCLEVMNLLKEGYNLTECTSPFFTGVLTLKGRSSPLHLSLVSVVHSAGKHGDTIEMQPELSSEDGLAVLKFPHTPHRLMA